MESDERNYIIFLGSIFTNLNVIYNLFSRTEDGLLTTKLKKTWFPSSVLTTKL